MLEWRARSIRLSAWRRKIKEAAQFEQHLAARGMDEADRRRLRLERFEDDLECVSFKDVGDPTVQ